MGLPGQPARDLDAYDVGLSIGSTQELDVVGLADKIQSGWKFGRGRTGSQVVN